MKKVIFLALVLSLLLSAVKEASAEGCHIITIGGQSYFCCDIGSNYTDCQKI